jgi:hypothetical protein
LAASSDSRRSKPKLLWRRFCSLSMITVRPKALVNAVSEVERRTSRRVSDMPPSRLRAGDQILGTSRGVPNQLLLRLGEP